MPHRAPCEAAVSIHVKLNHLSRYRYDRPVSLSPQVLHLRPALHRRVPIHASVILAGQIGGEPPRQFNLYAAGNFIEASVDTPYFQVGESKYGKPIVDRIVTCRTTLDEAAKCAPISMDSPLRSKLSVGLPLELLIHRRDELRAARHVNVDRDNPFLDMIHKEWGTRRRRGFNALPDPDWSRRPGEDQAPPCVEVVSS